MFVGIGLGGLIVLALWIYCILDVIATDEALIRNMPKVLWLVIVILLPTIGSIAWLILGRPESAGLRPGDTDYRSAHPGGSRFGASQGRASRPPRGPEDSPEFIASLDERSKEIRRKESELRAREDELRRREEEELRKKEEGPE